MGKPLVKQIIHQRGKGFYFVKWKQAGACNRWGEGLTQETIEGKVRGTVVPVGPSQVVRVPVLNSQFPYAAWDQYIKSYLFHIRQASPDRAQLFREVKMVSAEKEPDWEREERVVARNYSVRYYKIA